MKTKYIPLKTWIVDHYFHDRVATPDAWETVTAALKDAGFGEGVPKDRDRFVSEIATAALRKAVVCSVHTAAVVSAEGNCPHCQGSMADAQLSDGTPIRHCTKCRTSAFVTAEN